MSEVSVLPMQFRVTVSAIVQNPQGAILLCKMPLTRGAYPGQWAIPGGGIDEGETMYQALKREMREEVGLEIEAVVPYRFQDDTREKKMPDGTSRRVYMIHLVFDAKAVLDKVVLNDEFEMYAWVQPQEMKDYDLNDATRRTFTEKGWL